MARYLPTRSISSGQLTAMLAALALAGATGCGTDAEPPADTMPGAEAATPAQPPAPPAPAEPVPLSDEDRAAIAQLNSSLAALTTPQAAIDAGFTDQFPEGCRASDEGGQGVHYLFPGRLDAQIVLLEPELVMYEPKADGSHELVGVDYAVPFDQWTGTEPPTVLGRPLMRNEELGVWALHIWTHRENPSGTFAMWNPNVSCDAAG